ncbi:hypothetical protein GCM10008018_36500 [Paenibacillus marchantiophytorum]|uniref:DUF4304 domain-containing protein n=1 Tax=Paenibacillus marchantiophytorum TaxID=1619310 RepID=A0ABQ1EUD5_9BACL|nr:DUF5986 family protein [Paenibacillus marchantiophytorum]GFZ87029.1 hypothetical protein GCM10008018_36500 [Paenibacillus marchantiophytorum]
MLDQLGLNGSMAELLVRSFTEGTEGVINEIKQEHGMDTGNFKNGGSWDIRFDRIKQAALQNDLVVLTRKRGGIWTFICALDLNTGSLYIFSKEKNIDTVIKNFGKNKIHYFHAFVSLNSGPLEFDTQQMVLFETLTDEYENKRLMEAQRILGEEYPLVKQVIFVIAQEVDKKMIGVEARLFNRYFELIDKADWSMYVSKEEYSDLAVLNEDVVESIDIIPKVKPSVKKRKKHFDQEIATKKSDEKDIKEEDKG